MPAILYNPHSNIRIDGLRLGIVNNMPDKALLSTARQFLSVIEQAAPDFRVGQTRIDRQFGEGRTDVRDSSWPPQRQELRVARDVEECLCLSDQLVRGSPRVIRVIVGRVVGLGAARPLTTAWRAYTATGCRLRAARCGTRRAPPGGKLASA